MFKFNLFAAMLCLLTLNLMAQTLPRPAGPYFEPLREENQFGTGVLKSTIFLRPGHWIIPQIANGETQNGGFFTTFQAVNVSTSTATFKVDFFDSDGRPMYLPLPTSPNDLTGAPARGFQGTLSPGGYGAQVTIPNGSPTAVGYARVTAEPEESIGVNATFVQIVSGRPPFMAGVPLTTIFNNTTFMPYISGSGFTPSLALVAFLAQRVTLIARTGSKGTELCRAIMDLGNGHHRSFLLRDVLSCVPESEGVIEIRAGHELHALSAIGFQAHDEGAFVTQPVWTNLARTFEE